MPRQNDHGIKAAEWLPEVRPAWQNRRRRPMELGLVLAYFQLGGSLQAIPVSPKAWKAALHQFGAYALTQTQSSRILHLYPPLEGPFEALHCVAHSVNTLRQENNPNPGLTWESFGLSGHTVRLCMIEAAKKLFAHVRRNRLECAAVIIELPLMLGQDWDPILGPDTTKIIAQAAVAWAKSERNYLQAANPRDPKNQQRMRTWKAFVETCFIYYSSEAHTPATLQIYAKFGFDIDDAQRISTRYRGP